MVKYADGPAAEVSGVIAATPEAVWLLVTDIDLPKQFSPEFQGATWDSDDRGLGATFTGHNKHKAVGEWSTTSTITDFAEVAAFEWTVGDLENRTARWRWDLARADDGQATRVRFSAVMGPGPSGLSNAINKMPEHEEAIVAGRLAEWEANMAATVEGIKAMAEAG